jgi:Fe-S-cluster containining protein
MEKSSFDYYHQALETLDKQVAILEDEFRPYLQCKKGCSSCCENTQFKVRYIEALQLAKGFATLPADKQRTILENIGQESPDCPFLLDKCCSVYEYRPVLCRSFGMLIQIGEILGTCDLNFRDVKTGEPLKKLDLLPYYGLLDDLSAILWEAAAGPSTIPAPVQQSPPRLSIREFLSMLLKVNKNLSGNFAKPESITEPVEI